MLSIKTFIFVTAVILYSTIASFAQQGISPEKKALIQELRQLTESATLSISAKPTSTTTTETYTAEIEKDPELTDLQKQELMKLVAEVKEHIDKLTQDFFSDKLLMKQISD